MGITSSTVLQSLSLAIIDLVVERISCSLVIQVKSLIFSNFLNCYMDNIVVIDLVVEMIRHSRNIAD